MLFCVHALNFYGRSIGNDSVIDGKHASMVAFTLSQLFFQSFQITFVILQELFFSEQFEFVFFQVEFLLPKMDIIG